MTTVLSIAYCVLFLMSVFMIGLYCIHNRLIRDMKKTIHFLLNENREIKAKQRVFEKRFIQMSRPEKVVITNLDNDIKFGGDGI